MAVAVFTAVKLERLKLAVKNISCLKGRKYLVGDPFAHEIMFHNNHLFENCCGGVFCINKNGLDVTRVRGAENGT